MFTLMCGCEFMLNYIIKAGHLFHNPKPAHCTSVYYGQKISAEQREITGRENMPGLKMYVTGLSE